MKKFLILIIASIFVFTACSSKAPSYEEAKKILEENSFKVELDDKLGIYATNNIGDIVLNYTTYDEKQFENALSTLSKDIQFNKLVDEKNRKLYVLKDSTFSMIILKESKYVLSGAVVGDNLKSLISIFKEFPFKSVKKLDELTPAKNNDPNKKIDKVDVQQPKDVEKVQDENKKETKDTKQQ